MGVQKNATYKVHNGTDFDEINFKTIASQVKMESGIDLESGFANNKDSTGYTKLPNGLIIQWGDIKQTRPGWENFYPIQFPNACRIVVPISTSGLITFTLSIVNKTSFTVTASADLFGMRWLAIGY